MAPAIASPTIDPPGRVAPVADAGASEGRDLALRWSGQISLTRRIMAVNIVALGMLAFGFFYLDSYRSRLIDARIAQASRETGLIGAAIAASAPAARDGLLRQLANDTRARLRLYGADGRLLADSRVLGGRNFTLIDPAREPFGQDVGRFIDASIDWIVGAVEPPAYREAADGRDWADVAAARATGRPSATVWRAPDRTPIITAAVPLPGDAILVSANNERDITWTVRAERFRISMVLLGVTITSVLLSLFLARTIVRPIRRLARAAVRVRLGRAREVVVPRLPSRRDELGMLARALSDMSLALRARIDATEAFAADVTHELKNPLASLASAVEALGRVEDASLRERLLGIVRDDVYRLDRLITDISEASRLDAQLSRATFVPVDVVALVGALVEQRRERGVERHISARFDHVGDGPTKVLGDGARLERVFENLLDNAISFSPDRGVVTVAATVEDKALVVRIDDEGPGVSLDQREAVFRRFHSIRPSGEAFGRHSGLGLAIARTIVDGHQGSIMVESREDRMSGARFVVRLPLAPA